jgi:predicted deacylase
MIKEDFTVNNPPIFNDEIFRADKSGLFIPLKNVMESVTKGEVIGKIISIEDLSETKIMSPKEGTLLEIRLQDFVNTADDLFSIGTRTAATKLASKQASL